MELHWLHVPGEKNCWSMGVQILHPVLCVPGNLWSMWIQIMHLVPPWIWIWSSLHVCIICSSFCHTKINQLLPLRMDAEECCWSGGSFLLCHQSSSELQITQILAGNLYYHSLLKYAILSMNPELGIKSFAWHFEDCFKSLEPGCLLTYTWSTPIYSRNMSWVLFVLQVPGTPTHSLVLYYMVSQPLSRFPLLESFVHEDDRYRNSRFKLIPNIAKVKKVTLWWFQSVHFLHKAHPF